MAKYNPNHDLLLRVRGISVNDWMSALVRVTVHEDIRKILIWHLYQLLYLNMQLDILGMMSSTQMPIFSVFRGVWNPSTGQRDSVAVLYSTRTVLPNTVEWNDKGYVTGHSATLAEPLVQENRRTVSSVIWVKIMNIKILNIYKAY